MLSLFNTDCHIASQMVCFRCYSFGFMIIAQTAAFRYSHPSQPENIIVFIYIYSLFFFFRCFFLYFIFYVVASPLHSIEDEFYSKKIFFSVLEVRNGDVSSSLFMYVSFLSYLLSLPIYLPPIQCLYAGVCALMCNSFYYAILHFKNHQSHHQQNAKPEQFLCSRNEQNFSSGS